mmetsp:Transcript_32548/g.86664  ORF Transcript_32548/g.86664 Transcript_32548/m.86664 type:complete len:311 (-) Transcript_32548:280-1212(-)
MQPELPPCTHARMSVHTPGHLGTRPAHKPGKYSQLDVDDQPEVIARQHTNTVFKSGRMRPKQSCSADTIRWEASQQDSVETSSRHLLAVLASQRVAQGIKGVALLGGHLTLGRIGPHFQDSSTAPSVTPAAAGEPCQRRHIELLDAVEVPEQQLPGRRGEQLLRLFELLAPNGRATRHGLEVCRRHGEGTRQHTANEPAALVGGQLDPLKLCVEAVRQKAPGDQEQLPIGCDGEALAASIAGREVRCPRLREDKACEAGHRLLEADDVGCQGADLLQQRAPARPRQLRVEEHIPSDQSQQLLIVAAAEHL